jgi:hypothetical protein
MNFLARQTVPLMRTSARAFRTSAAAFEYPKVPDSFFSDAIWADIQTEGNIFKERICMEADNDRNRAILDHLLEEAKQTVDNQ